MAVFTLVILPDARTTREPFTSGCPCTHCVGFVRYTQTTSGGVRNGRERYASGWHCSVNARVDASGTSAHVCRLTYLFPLQQFVMLRIARVEIMTRWQGSKLGWSCGPSLPKLQSDHQIVIGGGPVVYWKTHHKN